MSELGDLDFLHINDIDDVPLNIFVGHKGINNYTATIDEPAGYALEAASDNNDEAVSTERKILPHSLDPRLSDCNAEDSFFANGQNVAIQQSPVWFKGGPRVDPAAPSVTEKLRSKIIKKYESEGRDIPELCQTASLCEEKLTHSELMKRKEKQERNKISARKSRGKKKEEFEKLQKRHSDLLKENDDLKNEVYGLQSKVEVFEKWRESQPLCSDVIMQEQEADDQSNLSFDTGGDCAVNMTDSLMIPSPSSEVLANDYTLEQLIQGNFAIYSKSEMDTPVVTSMTRYHTDTALPAQGFNIGVQENTWIQDLQICQPHVNNYDMSSTTNSVANQSINVNNECIMSNTIENNVASKTPWNVETQDLQTKKDESERMELVKYLTAMHE